MASPVSRDLQQYLWLQAGVKDLQSQADTIKKRLLEHAEAHGEVDDKGHKVFNFDDEAIIQDDATYIGFMKQRRVNQRFNEERAEALMKELGFKKKEYIETEEFVSQDKVSRLWAEERITDEQYWSLVDNNVSWAFYPVKQA